MAGSPYQQRPRFSRVLAEQAADGLGILAVRAQIQVALPGVAGSRVVAQLVVGPALLAPQVGAVGVERQRGLELVEGSGGISLSLIHISEPTRLLSISYAVFCL